MLRIGRTRLSVGLLAGLGAAAWSTLAMAQAPAQPQNPPPAQPAPAQPAPAQPAPAQPVEDPAAPAAQDPAAQPAPAPEQPAPPIEAQPQEEPAAAPAPADPAPAPIAEPPPADEAEPEEESPLDFMFFVDAYAGWQTAEVGSPSPVHRAYALNSPGFTAENGFSLSFAGLDVTYDQGTFAGTASLRFGPSVVLFHTNDNTLGIDNVIQAYATWRPVENLDLDLGQFGTIFGAEVAESWLNLNYTRGGLYYLMQPFWHTGLRGTYAFNDMFTLKAMVVNGANTISEAQDPADDAAPSLGLQLGVTPVEEFSVALGGLFATDAENDGSGFDRFADLVAVLSLDRFTMIFNADYNFNVGPDNQFWGASLAAGYAFTDAFGLAVRGEYLNDSDNALYAIGTADEVSVATVTGTIDVKPIPNSKNLILRWDNRFETSTEEIFSDFDGDGTEHWFSSVIGLVATTDG